jgi:predicted trehalose synthase
VLRERPDPESRRAAEAWIAGARSRFLAAYGPVDAELLRAFEVEKETYEFSYAATFLPSWMFVPRASMRALLAEPPTR